MLKRKINYYETDKMAVVHHSNYIRWFEESRIELMESINCPLSELEKHGIVIPVVDVYAKYLKMTEFGQTVIVKPIITKYNGARLDFRYEIYIEGDDTPCTTGTSTHCFVDKDGKVIRLSKILPEIHEKFKKLCE